jgi:hypothetical protein
MSDIPPRIKQISLDLEAKGYTPQITLCYSSTDPGRWEMRCHFGFRQVHGGWYDSPDEAIEAITRWALKMPEKIKK